jgi:hypothetical protein
LIGKYGKYEVIRKIGSGGFGVVYEGRDPLIKRRVAIKTCTSHDDGLRKRFFREAEIAGALQHRNIVTVFDLGVEDGVPYLVQEYLSGEDLNDKIKRREIIAINTRLHYLAQIAEGLEYAHAEGVVHRDIKPANIRILKDDNVKIMDFGIAKLASAETQLTHTGMAMGTAGYLPPEQIRGEPVDQRADVFSFGVLAYELLGGIRPFRGEHVSAVLFQIVGQDPDPLTKVWPACPERLGRLVTRCLEKDRKKRTHSFTEVLRELGPIRDELASMGDAPTQMLPAVQVPGPEAEETRQTLIGLAERLRATVGQGELTAAELEIDLARQRFGGGLVFEEIFEPLLSEIGLTRRRWEEERQRTEKLSGLLDRARKHRAAAELDEALFAAKAAQELEPKSEEAQALLRSIREARERRHEEEQRLALATRAGAQIAELLDRGELERAGEHLAEAFSQAGEIGPLPELKARRDAAVQELREASIARLVAEAERCDAEQRFESARDLLKEALELDPGRENVQRFLARVAASLREQAEGEKRQAGVAAIVSRIQELARREDFDAARSELKQAEEQWGRTERLKVLRRDLPELEKRAAAERVRREASEQEARLDTAAREAASRAESLIGRGELEEAQRALAEAKRQLGPRGPLPELEQRLAQVRQEKRAAAVDALAAKAGKLATEKKLEEAKAVLAQARELDPGRETVGVFQAQVQEAIRKRDEELAQRQIDVAAAEAKTAADRGDFDAARALLARARKEHGAHARFDELERRIVELQRSAVQQQLEQAVKDALSEAGGLADQGHIDRALQRLTQAERELGQSAELRRLRQQLAERQQREEAERQRQGRVTEAVAGVERLIGRGDLARARRELDKAERDLGRHASLQAVRGRLREAEDAARTAGPRTPVPVTAPPPGRPAWLPYALAAGALVGVLAVGGVIWNAVGPGDVDRAGAGDLPVDAGAVKLDALPWAEVTAVVDSEGRPQDLGGQRYTPLYLALPEGDYRISLSHPEAGSETSVEVSVRAGAVETRTVELAPVSADDYFARAGW